jgi:Glycosyl transferase family 2
MTLAAPNSALRACVVVPARDEEHLITSCLEAIATQERLSHDEYEILLVLDQCKDQTEARAREIALDRPHLRLHLLDGPGEGSGPARRVGMDAACARLLQVGRPEGLIACTDADTVVAPDWLAAQLRAVSDGARAIGGRIELADDGPLPESVWRRHAEEGRLRHEHLLRPRAQGRNTALAVLGRLHDPDGGSLHAGRRPRTAYRPRRRTSRKGSAPARRSDPSAAFSQGDDITSSGGKSHTRSFIRPGQDSTQPSRGKRARLGLYECPYIPLVGVRCYVSVHFTNTQSETARIRSFAPSTTGTTRSSPEAMSRTVQTPRASSSSPSMAA